MLPHDTTPIGVPSKKCTKCTAEKSATTEFFARDKSRADGLQAWCKVCQAAYRAKNTARIREYIAQWTVKNKEKTQEYKRNYSERNRERESLRLAIYRAKNAERIAERGRQWYRNNSDKTKVRARLWESSNRARYRELKRSIENRRRARKRDAEGVHSAEDVKRQYNAQRGKCYYCGVKVGDKYHTDHAVPLARGGSNGPENIVIACPTCNISKGDKLPHEWAQGGRLI